MKTNVRRFDLNIDCPACVRCGASIAVLRRCHSCEYEQEEIYNDPETSYFLALSDYRLALVFFPHSMMADFRPCQEYAAEIRKKLVTYSGRHDLQELTEGRWDGWVFTAAV